MFFRRRTAVRHIGTITNNNQHNAYTNEPLIITTTTTDTMLTQTNNFDASEDPFLMEIIGNEGSREDPSFCYQDETSEDFILRTISSIQFQPIAPGLFLAKLMISRGYEPIFRPLLTGQQLRVVPSVKQIEDYDNDLIHAVRNSNLSKIADHYR